MTAKYSAGASAPEDLAHHLRAVANSMDAASCRSWKFKMGFLWGAIFMTTLDIGELHLWGGECGSAGIWLLGGQP